MVASSLEEITLELEELQYPDTDGEPMAESDFQLIPLIYVIEALRLFFAARPDVYVAGNMLLYYEQGNRRAVIAPDAFVVFGVEKRLRRSYLLWREGKAPDFVLEITSESTRAIDQETKRRLYALLGVREYFQFDPTGDYLQPSLQGLRLEDGEYVSLPATTLPDGTQALLSETLGLELRLSPDGEFRLYDPENDAFLLTYEEESMARRAAEARLAELEARLRALGDDPAATD